MTRPMVTIIEQMEAVGTTGTHTTKSLWAGGVESHCGVTLSRSEWKEK